MRGIEKALTSYTKGNGRKLSKEALTSFMEEDANDAIQTLLKVIEDTLDEEPESLYIDRLKDVFCYIKIILSTSSDVDRKMITRKLNKLDAKLDRIKVERKYKFSDKKKAYQKLEKIRKEIEEVEEQVEFKETKQYDFMNYLITDVKNITYIECALQKLPYLVNIRDKFDTSLFQNTLKYYLGALQKEEQKDSLYYSNVLSLILSQKEFHMSEKEKRKQLDILYRISNQMSKNKASMKYYKNNLKEINALIKSLKGMSEKDTRIERIAEKYNIPVFFEKGILDQINLVKTSLTETNNRYLVDDYVLTIDKADSIEIDDALSCKKLENGNYLLGVHVASVLGYFPYESKIVTEAFSRSKSIYLPEKYQIKENDYQRIIPMFPYDFSANKASLLKGVPRLARSYYFEIDRDGHIVEETFLKTVVTNNRKTTYQEIDEVLEHGCANKKLQQTVENLYDVSEILDKRYKTSPVYEEYKESSIDYSDLRVRRVGAEKIVYQAMLLTGNRVAEFFADKGYPCLYRVHSLKEENKEALKKRLEDLSKSYGGEQYQRLYQLLKGIYPKGWYDIAGSHEGLGVKHHCHCTSNLRRSADLVVEHALEICHDKKPSDKELILLENDVWMKANQINAKEEPIDWFVKEYKRSYRGRR